MRAILQVMALACLFAAPVAAQDRNSFSYRPPDRQPPGPGTRYVELPADRVLPRIERAFRAQRLIVETVDPEQRRIVARYTGDGRAYVDCGTVEMLVDGQRQRPPKRYSGNRPDARTFRVGEGRRVGLYREIVLDARVVTQLALSGKGTEVSSEAVYVVTKSVYHVVGGGEVGMLADREIISFRSAETGRFAKGTRCVATGKLEALPASSLRSLP